MNIEFQKLSLKNDIQSKVRNDLDQQQREYYLNQQLKTIQEELGSSSIHKDIEDIRNGIHIPINIPTSTIGFVIDKEKASPYLL